MKGVLFCLVFSFFAVGYGSAWHFNHRSCAAYMKMRYPNCSDGEICRYYHMGKYIYQRRVESEKCDTGFAGEFNRTMSGRNNNCTMICKSDLKYICEPSLEDKAALLVESLSLGVDAEETATTAAPTQSSRRLQFRFPYFLNRFKKSSYYYRFRSMSALSTDNTCPADGTSQADNTICEDICTRNATDGDPPKPSEPIDPDTPVEPFDLEEFRSQANKSRHYRCCGNRDGDRYILFVLDNSKAVSEAEFTSATNFVCSLTKQLCGNVKIAVMTYDDAINLEFCFNCSSTREDVCTAVERIKYRGGEETRTASAISCVVDEVLTQKCGFPQSRWYSNRHVDVVFITSGENNGACQADLTSALSICKRRGYATHVISVDGAPAAFQLAYYSARNFTNVLFLDDLTELTQLSGAIDDELTRTGDDGNFINTCTRDSARCSYRGFFRPYFGYGW
jgi:hypothetical protein